MTDPDNQIDIQQNVEGSEGVTQIGVLNYLREQGPWVFGIVAVVIVVVFAIFALVIITISGGSGGTTTTQSITTKPTDTPMPTPTDTLTFIWTPSPTDTPTLTSSPTSTSTNTPTFTQTPSPTETFTPTVDEIATQIADVQNAVATNAAMFTQTAIAEAVLPSATPFPTSPVSEVERGATATEAFLHDLETQQVRQPTVVAATATAEQLYILEDRGTQQAPAPSHNGPSPEEEPAAPGQSPAASEATTITLMLSLTPTEDTTTPPTPTETASVTPEMPTPTPSATIPGQCGGAVQGYGRIQTEGGLGANVRAEPSQDSERIGGLAPGDIVTIYDLSNGWYCIGDGWVWGVLVNFVDDTTTLTALPPLTSTPTPTSAEPTATTVVPVGPPEEPTSTTEPGEPTSTPRPTQTPAPPTHTPPDEPPTEIIPTNTPQPTAIPPFSISIGVGNGSGGPPCGTTVNMTISGGIAIGNIHVWNGDYGPEGDVYPEQTFDDGNSNHGITLGGLPPNTVHEVWVTTDRGDSNRVTGLVCN